MLALIDQCEAVERGEEWLSLTSTDITSKVVGVDVDIRGHNRRAIEAHPLSGRIHLVEGSSTDAAVIDRVVEEVGDRSPVVVLLDSNHAAGHVRDELAAYAELTTVGSYCVVYDTVIEQLPAELHDDRPWGPGDSPATAVDWFLSDHDGFRVDRRFDERLGITVAPGGYLKRVH
jgi:cephalosporin hydroxylase